MNKKNVGIIVQKLKNGGAERAAANLTKDLSKNYNVYLILFDATNITYEYDGTLIDLNIPPASTRTGKFINVFKRIHKTKKIKKECDLDYCISFMENANIVNIFSKRREKIITSERNMDSFFNKSKLKKFITKYICKKADKVVSLSKLVKEDLIENFNVDENKIIVIYNSCDKNRLNIVSKEIQEAKKSLKLNERYIITMGRLNFQKGQWHAIRAMKKVKEKIPNSKLIILGKGELEQDLKQLAKNMHLEDDIIFFGYIKNPHTILEKCDVFIFPSIVEGLGNVLLEALAFNKAIIAADCTTGPREILAPNTDIKYRTNNIEYGEYGILTKPFPGEITFNNNDICISKEEEILSKAIIELLENKKLKEEYENKATQRIKDFNPERIKEQWIQLLESL